jgi:hypothetical protein
MRGQHQHRLLLMFHLLLLLLPGLTMFYSQWWTVTVLRADLAVGRYGRTEPAVLEVFGFGSGGSGRTLGLVLLLGLSRSPSHLDGPSLHMVRGYLRTVAGTEHFKYGAGVGTPI